MKHRKNIAAIISAAGSSVRMGGVKKEYMPLGNDYTDSEGKPLSVLASAVSAFVRSQHIETIIITVPLNPEYGEYAARASLPESFLKEDSHPKILFVPGGIKRRISVHHALSLLSAYSPDYVLIHDGARPWVDTDLIEKIIDSVIEYNAVIPCLPVIETPKEIDGQGFVLRHLKRANVETAQTPQAFAYPDILHAHEKAAERELRDSVEYTDDAEVWGEFMGNVKVIKGSPENRKITFPEDIFKNEESL